MAGVALFLPAALGCDLSTPINPIALRVRLIYMRGLDVRERYAVLHQNTHPAAQYIHPAGHVLSFRADVDGQAIKEDVEVSCHLSSHKRKSVRQSIIPTSHPLLRQHNTMSFRPAPSPAVPRIWQQAKRRRPYHW
jgi:hypothetical protein